MRTVPELTEKYLLQSPFLEEGVARGIINLSALAREFRPALEAELGKRVTPAAIVMALKRLSPRLTAPAPRKPRAEKRTGDLIVRSNLAEFTFRHSESIWEKQKKLLHCMARDREAFLTFTQGVFEVMLIASAGIERAVVEIFGKENIVSHLPGLSAIVIRLSPRSVHVPGVYYAILKQLAWEGVNVIDVVSTFTEFTILIEKQQVDRAFRILTKYLWP
jgi:hypothetical protein